MASVFWSCNWCNTEHEAKSEDKVPVPQCDSVECRDQWLAAEAERVASEKAAGDAVAAELAADEPAEGVDA